jgi:hypothetical protein
LPEVALDAADHGIVRANHHQADGETLGKRS